MTDVTRCAGCKRSVERRRIPDNPLLRYWNRASVPNGDGTREVWVDSREGTVVCPWTRSGEHEVNDCEHVWEDTGFANLDVCKNCGVMREYDGDH
jgi:hypothetical protein